MTLARILSIISYFSLAILAILGIIFGNLIPKTLIAILFVTFLTIFGFSFGHIVDHLKE